MNLHTTDGSRPGLALLRQSANVLDRKRSTAPLVLSGLVKRGDGFPRAAREKRRPPFKVVAA